MDDCSFFGSVHDRDGREKWTPVPKQCKTCVHLADDKGPYRSRWKGGKMCGKGNGYEGTPYGKCKHYKHVEAKS